MIMQIVIHQYLIHLQQALMQGLHLGSWCGLKMVHLPDHPLRVAHIVCNAWMIPGWEYMQ